MVWIWGESFGGIFAPGLSWLTGAPGAEREEAARDETATPAPGGRWRELVRPEGVRAAIAATSLQAVTAPPSA